MKKKIILQDSLSKRKNHRKKQSLPLARLTNIIFFIVFISCNQKSDTTKPVVARVTESVYASGIIKAENQYQVFPTVNGIISKILVTENDLVKRGSPLMQVSDKTSIINNENALLSAEYSGLNANQEKLSDVKNIIALAQSKYENDSLLFKRQQNLWKENIGSRIELEQKELAFQNSKTALEAAKLKYNDLLKQLKYYEQQSRNNLAISRTRVGDLTIKSEINGKVYSLAKKVGEMVNTQTSLALIGDASHFLMELQIDEYDIAKIKLGQKVLVSMDSYKGNVFESTISKIYPIMNERTKSFSVEAEFTKRPPVLYPNLTVEANIIIQTKEKALLIPRNYLIKDSLVLIGKDKTKVVVTGLKDYQKVEILKGLTADDIIYQPKQ